MHSKAVAEGQEQRVDPVLPLILAHPERRTPDASEPLSGEELAGKNKIQLVRLSNLVSQIWESKPCK